MDKTQYINFHTYTEVKSAFILAEEIKSSKMNTSSKTKKSKDNSSRAANSGNNKNKESKNKKKDHHSNTNSWVNKKNCPCSAPTADRMVTFQLHASKTHKGRDTKVNKQSMMVVRNINLMTWILQRQKNLNNSKHGVKSRGSMVTIPPDPQRWIMLN